MNRFINGLKNYFAKRSAFKLLESVVDGLSNLRMELELIDEDLKRGRTDPIDLLVRFFNLVLVWPNTDMEKLIKKFGAIDDPLAKLVTDDLVTLKKHFIHLRGRNESVFLAPKIGVVTDEDVYLGNVNGLGIYSVSSWKKNLWAKKHVVGFKLTDYQRIVALAANFMTGKNTEMGPIKMVNKHTLGLEGALRQYRMPRKFRHSDLKQIRLV